VTGTAQECQQSQGRPRVVAYDPRQADIFSGLSRQAHPCGGGQDGWAAEAAPSELIPQRDR
jgi:hypothetical protein